MMLTPSRLIAFRMLNLTLCRMRTGDRALRGLLARLLKSGGAQAPYCQSADFFSFDQITARSPAAAAKPDRSPTP